MPVTFEEALVKENMELREALENLIDRSGHISPLGGEASVAAVRRAGKYMEAVEHAQKLLGRIRDEH